MGNKQVRPSWGAGGGVILPVTNLTPTNALNAPTAYM